MKKARLRKGLTRDRARDTLWLLMAPDQYQRLVKDAGWRPEDYETWLGDTYCQQLLD